MSNYTDDDMIVSQLLNSGEVYIKKLYDRFEQDFYKFIVSRFQCDQQQAMDIYPECFAKFYYNIKDGKLTSPLTSSLKTYLFAIGKHTFMKNNFGTYQKKTALESSLPEEMEQSSILNFYDYEDQKALVQKLMQNIGEKCRQLLEMMYIKEMSSEVVCEHLSIDNPGTLRKRKFDCMQKMRQLYHTIAKS